MPLTDAEIRALHLQGRIAEWHTAILEQEDAKRPDHLRQEAAHKADAVAAEDEKFVTLGALKRAFAVIAGLVAGLDQSILARVIALEGRADAQGTAIASINPKADAERVLDPIGQRLSRVEVISGTLALARADVAEHVAMVRKMEARIAALEARLPR